MLLMVLDLQAGSRCFLDLLLWLTADMLKDMLHWMGWLPAVA